jgi:glucosamine--fructose-6-phosphate aminotransferase (isomerizing)
MTELLNDILKEPVELERSLAYTLGPGRGALDQATALVRQARHVTITGIGSSWYAGMAVLSLFDAAGRPARLVEASELLHFGSLPEGTVLIALSRSGRSIEVVNLLDKAATAGARVIGITNAPDSPLATRSEVTLLLQTAFDHNVSITMYSAPMLVGGLLAAAAVDRLDAGLAQALAGALDGARRVLPEWQQQLQGSDWFKADAPTYFLARGGSVASAYEARLLWEEGAKAPASAMTTGGFRHGPQEIVVPDLRIGLWIDAARMREPDLALAADLRRHGVKLLLIGQNLPPEAGDLVFALPPIPSDWQFLVDIIPVQLAAEYLAQVRGVDCDNFRICPYIVESEEGLPARGTA